MKTIQIPFLLLLLMVPLGPSTTYGEKDNGLQLGIGFIPQVQAPDISGKWQGTGWGDVKVRQKVLGQISGTYTDTFGGDGKFEAEWNAGEGRFYGRWWEGDKVRGGDLSIRLDEESRTVRGAWTANLECQIQPGIPRLADLEWKRIPSKK